MSLQNSLGHASTFAKLSLLVALMGIGTILAIVILFALNQMIFHVPLDVVSRISDSSSLQAIRAAKILQITTQIGMFVLPAIAYAYISSPRVWAGLGIQKISLKSLVWVVAIALLSIPFINLLADWNSNWHLPESWQTIENWMRTTQAQNDAMLKVLIQMNTPTDIALNILMMAILPAIGEELIFRGVLQTEFIKTTRNPHIGIFIAAILFSAIHMQFLGFFARAILGIIFGYLFYFSKNIFTAIAAHFINNFLALVIALLFGTELAESSFDNPYSIPTITWVVVLFITAVGLLIRFGKSRGRV